MAEEKPAETAAASGEGATEAATAADPPKKDGEEGAAEGEAGEPKKKEHVVSIVLSYMDDEHEKAAIEVTIDAFDKYTKYKDVAQHIKKEYDARYPSSGKSTDGVYHAVVGKHFGASFSHETSNYVHLKCDLHNVIIFKSKDSPFDLDAANV